MDLEEKPKINPAANHPPVFVLSTGRPRKSTAALSSVPLSSPLLATRTYPKQYKTLSFQQSYKVWKLTKMK